MLSLIEALQVLIIVVFIYSFIPITCPPVCQKLFPISLYDVHPKREIFFYHVWIAAALGLQGVMMFINRRRLGEEDLWRKFLPYICTMAGIVIIQIFVVFKVFLWGNPGWARDLFYAPWVLGPCPYFLAGMPAFHKDSWGKGLNQKIPRGDFFNGCGGYLDLDSLDLCS